MCAAGEYRIAVWSDDSLPEPRPFSIGLGLAERDVFSPTNLVLFDYTLMRIQAWNGWHPLTLLLPLLLSLALMLAALVHIRKKRPRHFGTSSGWPTPLRLLACLAGSLIFGHVIANLAILCWAAGGSAHAGNEFIFPMVTQIILPLVTSTGALLVGLRVPCCCGGDARAHCGHRVAVLVSGILHLMLHAGYVVAPVLLIVAAVLPPSVAHAGLEQDEAEDAKVTRIVSNEGSKGTAAAVGHATTSTSTAAAAGPTVEETPKQMQSLV